MIKFPWDCKDCPMLHTYDLSIDDLTHVCLWSKNQIDDCDRYKYAECPLEKHDKGIRADERRKVLDEVYKIIINQMIKHGTELDFNLETQELILQMKEGAE